MLNGLSSTELASAKLPQAYDDLLVGPQKDGQYPSTQQGLAISALSTAQKALVKAAINSYAADANNGQAAAYTTDAALNNTYIAWASYSDLATKGSYVRIDGPKVWIELSVQSGIVFKDNHYHSIWRDKEQDYGGNLTFSSSSSTTGTTTGTPPTGTPPTGTPPTGTPPTGTTSTETVPAST
jgi:hypothetical protein